jgi:5,5'-dehydrodivanillate O-demethylase
MSVAQRTAGNAPELVTEEPTDFVRTGPGTLAGRYLRKFWQPVFVGRKLQPGWSKPITIMSESFALYRSQDGTAHCVDNRCAHRGAKLSTGWVEGDNIRCPYHGWAFGPDGQCVHQPLEREGYAQNIRIGGYPTREYLGLVYVYFGEGEPPEFPRYKEWEDAKFVAAQIDVRPCNWFQNVENFVDEGHIWFTHTNSALANLNLDDLPKITTEKTPWGLSNIATPSDGRRRIVQFGMPNCGMFAVHPDNIKKPGEVATQAETAWQMFLDYRVPVDDVTHLQVHAIATFMEGEPTEAYRARWAKFDAAEAQAHDIAGKVLAGELQYDDIARLCHHIPLAQDEVVQVGQGRIADRRKGVEHLGASDAGIVALRRLYTEELRAFAEGRTLQNWHRPVGLLPLSGDH